MRKLLAALCLAILALGTYSLNHTWQRMEKAREVADFMTPAATDFIPWPVTDCTFTRGVKGVDCPDVFNSYSDTLWATWGTHGTIVCRVIPTAAVSSVLENCICEPVGKATCTLNSSGDFMQPMSNANQGCIPADVPGWCKGQPEPVEVH